MKIDNFHGEHYSTNIGDHEDSVMTKNSRPAIAGPFLTLEILKEAENNLIKIVIRKKVKPIPMARSTLQMEILDISMMV